MSSSVAERVHALIRAVPPGPVSSRNRALLVLVAAGGLRLGSFHRKVDIGDRLKGEIAPRDEMPSGSFEAEVVHASREHGLGLRFLSLSPSLAREISRFA